MKTISHSIRFLPALLLLVGCNHKSPEKSAGGGDVIAVHTTSAEEVSWDRDVDIIGTLFPKDQATLGAEIEGTVENTFVEFGQRVAAGKELAIIDSKTYAAELEQAQANVGRAAAQLESARLNYERAQKIPDKGALAANELDRARTAVAQWEAEVKAAESAVALARLKLDHCRIIAPFDGAISQRIITKGDFVKVGAPLFELVNDRVLKFIFQAPERFGSDVKVELPVAFNVDNYPGRTFSGKVYLISPVVTAGSRAFNVGALVSNDDLALKASSFARGKIVLGAGKPTAVVPLDAVVSFAGVTKVFVAKADRAEGRQVSTGRTRDGKTEILSGIQAGDAVIVSGLSKLTEGARIKIADGGTKPANGHGEAK